jgi:hypothetical protein
LYYEKEIFEGNSNETSWRALNNFIRSYAKGSKKAKIEQDKFDKEYLSGKADCLYRQTAGSWNGVATLGGVIICDHVSATRRFCYVL